MKTVYSGYENILVLASSFVGSVTKCECYDSYYLSIGNMTLKLRRSDVWALTEMLVNAVEADSLYDPNNREYRQNA